MRKLYFLISFLFIASLSMAQNSVIITRVVDGGLPSDGCSGSSGASSPKAIELYVDGTVDFTNYTYDLYSNGSATVTVSESLADLGSVSNGFVYIIALGEITFDELVPGATKHIGGGSFNGDDTITITDGTSIVDQFGVIGTDGSGQSWEYLDTYAKRNDATGPNTTFTIGEWSFGAVNEFDGTTCPALSSAVSFGAYSLIPCGVSLGSANYICSSNTIGDNNDPLTIEIPYTGSDAGITSVTTTSAGSVFGDNPSTDVDGTIVITGLSEGDSWDITLNGGGCDGTTISATVPTDECDPDPNTCFDLSGGSEFFELVVVTPNSQNDEWTNTAGTYEMNGYVDGGQEQVETWLIFGPLDMTSVSDLELVLDATEQFGVTDLVVAYTSAYSGCPSGSTWTTAQTLTATGFYDVDLSAASGTAVFIGVQYIDDGLDSYSGWSLSNVALEAYGTCPTLGTRPISNCATCDLSLQTENYVCLTETTGDNNDGVTVEIPYTGSEGTLTSLTTTSGGTVGGDDPMTVADGTITITGLSEGDAWDLTLNGGDCDGTTVSGTIPAGFCEPALTLPFTENFTYPDGSLFGNGQWESSDDSGDLLVSSGQAVVQHGTPAEDVFLPFTPVSGILYYGIDFSVIDPGGPISGTDSEYFAHFKDTGFNYSARLDVVPPTGAGDFSVGIASDESTADAVWATDLSFGTTYRAIVKYDQDTNLAQLWIDATLETDTSILGEDRADPGDSVVSFALRQSDSSNNEGILVDNLTVSQTFADATLGVNNLEFNDFNVYPNPTNTGFVNITTVNSEVINAKVFDVLGKQVLEGKVENNQLDVSKLNAGLYMVKLTQNKASVTKKLIIK